MIRAQSGASPRGGDLADMTAAPPRESPSPWVSRHLSLIPRGGRVLDLACGSGRHALALAGAGLVVEAVDRDASALASLAEIEGVSIRQYDLESDPWPYFEEQFDGIVVTRYLYRPRLPVLAAALRQGGVLIYETFMTGHERYGRPTNPDFLLQPWELLRWAREAGLHSVAFEQGLVVGGAPAVLQRIVARRD